MSCCVPYLQDLGYKVSTSSPSHPNFILRPALGQPQGSPECSFLVQKPVPW